MSLYFHADSEKENNGRFMEARIFSRISYSCVLIIALFAYVNIFRGYWYVLVVYFMPGMIYYYIITFNYNKEMCVYILGM